MSRKTLVAMLIASTFVLAAAAGAAADPWDRDRDRDIVGAVYTMTNSATGNEVVVFHRDDAGILTKADSVSTGGNGFGGALDPLGSQGSLVLSADHRWLFAVNAGSNEISVFRVLPTGLTLVDKIDSGGLLPVSVTVFHDLLYVLNAGTSPNITGFSFGHRGHLIPLNDSTRFLESGGFAQVGFDPQGEKLVVTDKPGNRILVFSVTRDGTPSMTPAISPSNGLTPFAFVFDQRGHLLVSEAGGGAVTSYKILDSGTLQVISPSVANGQTATCWIVATGRNVFTANPGSKTISAYTLRIGSGKIALRNAAAGAANTPLDSGITGDGRFLYALDPGNGNVHIWKIKNDGSLTDRGEVTGGLAVFAQGLAVR